MLQGSLRIRVREIIAQAADQMCIKIVNGVLSADHVHVFVEIPPHISVSEFVKIAKGRSSGKIQQEISGDSQEILGLSLLGKRLL